MRQRPPPARLASYMAASACVSRAGIDYPADTTRAIARRHYGNTFARTPDVRYIFSHAGRTVPYLAPRR